jgi:N-acyl-D-aspartate/D-glutamate deacylase
MLRLGFALLAAATLAGQEFDILIAGARIVDGSGNPWYYADLGIKDGVIREVGYLAAGRAAKRRIEATGLVAAPGFIDMMGATSLPLLLDPVSAQSKLRQGITTMMAGEGNSEAPQRDRTLAQYVKLLETAGIGLNVVHNVGAAQVRRLVIGEEDRPPTARELAAMMEHVGRASMEGAVGLSTALIYPPGTFASRQELVALARATAPYGGFYSTHMRNESAGVLEAIREAIAIGAEAGVPVHIYHLKAAGEENWPLMARAIALIAEARSKGQDVTADIYPYIRNGLGLGSFIHPARYAKGAAALRAQLADPKIREEIRREIETRTGWENWYRHVGSNWDNVLVAQTPRPEDKRFEGKSVAEIAKLRGTDVWDTFFDFVRQGDPSVNPKSMNEEQKHLALRAEFVSFCTDAPPTNPASATGAHPRAFGSFPRILAKYVREERVISLEAAIRKMTSLPANRLQLYDRGRIAPGMAADVVLFDPERVRDTATFEKPLSYPEGLPYVIVNGRLAVDGSKDSGERAGRVLRSKPRP